MGPASKALLGVGTVCDNISAVSRICHHGSYSYLTEKVLPGRQSEHYLRSNLYGLFVQVGAAPLIDRLPEDATTAKEARQHENSAADRNNQDP